MPNDGFVKGRPRLVKPNTQTPKGETYLPAHVLVDMAMPGWDTRGLGGGGTCRVRNMFQRRRPAKGSKLTTRQAHPGYTKGVYPLRVARNVLTRKEVREIMREHEEGE